MGCGWGTVNKRAIVNGQDQGPKAGQVQEDCRRRSVSGCLAAAHACIEKLLSNGRSDS